MAPACVARAKATLGSVWQTLQFEHHGIYSLERAQLLLGYLRERSIAFKTPLTLVLTPVPCVVALTLMDCIPLQDPSRGVEANIGFLARSLLAVMGYTAFIVGQIHVCVPNLLRMRSLLWIAPLVASATNGANYLMSLCIGFPLPFTHVLGLVPWVSSLLMSLWIAIGSEGRRSQTVRRAFNEHGALIMAQSSLGVVYPLFYRLFLVSSPTAQFFVVLLLPVIKLAMKFRIHQVTPHIQDLQPVTLTFNAEVFNSLFTASCMRGSSSTVTSVALMSIDFLHSTYCLVRLNGLVANVEQLGMQFNVSREKMLPAVTLLAKQIPQEVWEAHGVPTRTHGNAKVTAIQPIGVSGSETSKSSVSTSPISTTPKLFTKTTRVLPHEKQRSLRSAGRAKYPHAVVPTPLPSNSSKRQDAPASAAHEGLDATVEDQIRCARRVLAVFRRTEYLVLVEYTEVIVPMVYGASAALLSSCITTL
jgi:hypothetical protein